MAPFCFLMILKSKGYSVYSKDTAELEVGNEKLPSGSIGKTPYCGHSKRLLLGSVILNEKSKNVCVWNVKVRVLMMGEVSLMK